MSLFHFGFTRTSDGDNRPKQGENKVQGQTEGNDTDIATSLDNYEQKRKRGKCLAIGFVQITGKNIRGWSTMKWKVRCTVEFAKTYRT